MLTQNQIDIIIETMKPFDPVMIGVFGSFARDEETEESDIDIMYAIEVFSFKNLLKTCIKLEDALNKKIDLVPFKDMYQHVRANAVSDLKIIYEDRSSEKKQAQMRVIDLEIEKSKQPDYIERAYESEIRRLDAEIMKLRKQCESIENSSGR